MSAHEAPGVPDTDQPPTPDHREEMEQVERLKAEVGHKVGMLRDEQQRRQRRAWRIAAAAAGGALAGTALIGGLLARRR